MVTIPSLIKRLKDDIKFNDDCQSYSRDRISWKDEEGILITVEEAELFIELLGKQ